MTSPFVRRNRLATELRTLREQRGMTAEDLSRQIFRSRMTISKLENARCRPQINDVLKILDALAVDDGEWRRILDIARDAAERGWWDSYGDAMGPRHRMYADVESGADTIRGYNQMSIPGLVQSPEFIQAIIDLDLAEGSKLAYEPERVIAARVKRQEMLFKHGGPHIEIILDEFVLTRLAVPSSFLLYTFPDSTDGSMAIAESASFTRHPMRWQSMNVSMTASDRPPFRRWSASRSSRIRPIG